MPLYSPDLEPRPRNVDVLEALMDHNHVHGIPYSNITVSNERAGLVDTLDPSIELDWTHVAMHWPGGGTGGQTYEALIRPDHDSTDMLAERLALRAIILGTSIGRAALVRIPEAVVTSRREFNNKHRGQAVPFVMATCVSHDAPMGVLQVNTVVSSSSGGVPVGSKVAHLWYPTVLSPKPVLANLKAVVRRTIAEETG